MECTAEKDTRRGMQKHEDFWLCVRSDEDYTPAMQEKRTNFGSTLGWGMTPLAECRVDDWVLMCANYE